jgi:hypothetical protein
VVLPTIHYINRDLALDNRSKPLLRDTSPTESRRVDLSWVKRGVDLNVILQIGK